MSVFKLLKHGEEQAYKNGHWCTVVSSSLGWPETGSQHVLLLMLASMYLTNTYQTISVIILSHDIKTYWQQNSSVLFDVTQKEQLISDMLRIYTCFST